LLPRNFEGSDLASKRIRQSVEATQAEDIRRENYLMMLNLKDSMNENNRKEIVRLIRNKMELLVRQIFKWPRRVAMLP
jgi:DNA invertase Pin-like site-specific DNA recombinase